MNCPIDTCEPRTTGRLGATMGTTVPAGRGGGRSSTSDSTSNGDALASRRGIWMMSPIAAADPLAPFAVSREAVAAVCRQFGVQELLLIGVRSEGLPPADRIDLAVEFLPDVRPTLFTLENLQEVLRQLFRRRVQVESKEGLTAALGAELLESARPLYAS